MSTIESTKKGLKLIECPRDAMQGWPHFIPTDQKVAYIQQLLSVGFDTLDFGSFVSPKAIPQMADTHEVIKQLDLSGTDTKLLAIIANERGAQDAVLYESIHYLGFPFSISPTFQQRNTNSSIEESLKRVAEIQHLCLKNNKQLVVYISMAFGNLYGDAYDESLVFEWVQQLTYMDINIISLADTVGLASPDQVYQLTSHLIQLLPSVEIGVHLHSTAAGWKAKTDAALRAGCQRFDGALKGIGGCPMANDELVGNMDTELLIPYFESKGLLQGLHHDALQKSSAMAAVIFKDENASSKF
ncbi:MAG: hydroxymethylglutaryl-CoA lyase [Ferruginibacter sp.]